MNTSIVVPNYNGRLLLARNLSAIQEASESVHGETIVVDDGSTDGSAEFVRKHFPRVHLVRLEQNVGFGIAVNAGVAESCADIVILLNSDMLPQENSLEPLLAPFEDESVFGVMAQQFTPDDNGPVYNGPVRGAFRRGFFRQIFEQRRTPFVTRRVSFFASGGGSAFRRSMFASLGGFDPIFRPIYWEDVDLCLRAWRRGWRVLYEPQSLILHEGSQTMKTQSSAARTGIISARNAWLLVWKNALDRMLVLNHFLFAVPSLIGSIVRPSSYAFAGFQNALPRLGAALARRRVEQAERKMTDAAILKYGW